MRVDVDGGKYTIVVRDNGAHVDILRHGEEWVRGGSTYPQAGGKFLIAVAHEIAELRKVRDEAAKIVAQWEAWKAGKADREYQVDALAAALRQPGG
jgi:hypothetical protein